MKHELPFLRRFDANRRENSFWKFHFEFWIWKFSVSTIFTIWWNDVSENPVASFSLLTQWNMNKNVSSIFFFFYLLISVFHLILLFLVLLLHQGFHEFNYRKTIEFYRNTLKTVAFEYSSNRNWCTERVLPGFYLCNAQQTSTGYYRAST